MMQCHVDHAELQLPQHLRGRSKRPGLSQLHVQLFRQHSTRLVMPRHLHQRVTVQAPRFHKLARQLHRVPLHPADARSVALVHRRQHVLQTVTKFMKQRFHLAEGHQRGLPAGGGSTVADQMSNRQPRATHCH